MKISFEAHRNSFSVNSSAMIPTVTPNQINGRRLQTSELQLYDVETKEKRKLQTICPSVEECLTKYQNVKIVKVY
jgi:hypothetical protein